MSGTPTATSCIRLPLKSVPSNRPSPAPTRAKNKNPPNRPHLAQKSNARPTSRVLDTTPTPGTNFLSLPPEIRNKIYSLTLHHRRKIFIGKHGATIKPRLRLYNPTHANKTCGWSGEYKNIKIHKQLNVKILLANKQINKEATPILYGGNRFVFGDFGRLNVWAGQIGRSFELLRGIEIYGDNLSRFVDGGMPPTFAYKAESLKILKLSVDACALDDHRGMAEMLSLFMKGDLGEVVQGGEGREDDDKEGCKVVFAETPTSRTLRRLFESGTHSGGYPDVEQVVKFGERVRRQLGRLLWMGK